MQAMQQQQDQLLRLMLQQLEEPRQTSDAETTPIAVNALGPVLEELKEERVQVAEMLENVRAEKLEVIALMHGFQLSKELALQQLEDSLRNALASASDAGGGGGGCGGGAGGSAVTNPPPTAVLPAVGLQSPALTVDSFPPRRTRSIRPPWKTRRKGLGGRQMAGMKAPNSRGTAQNMLQAVSNKALFRTANESADTNNAGGDSVVVARVAPPAKSAAPSLPQTLPQTLPHNLQAQAAFSSPAPLSRECAAMTSPSNNASGQCLPPARFGPSGSAAGRAASPVQQPPFTPGVMCRAASPVHGQYGAVGAVSPPYGSVSNGTIGRAASPMQTFQSLGLSDVAAAANRAASPVHGNPFGGNVGVEAAPQVRAASPVQTMWPSLLQRQ